MQFAGIVAIGWLYVTVLMAASQPTILSGIMTFLFYGVLPVTVILYIWGAPLRRRRRKAQEAAEATSRRPPPEAK